jgi:hypothetical protein
MELRRGRTDECEKVCGEVCDGERSRGKGEGEEEGGGE